jgi:hypothetical protein
MAFSVQLRKITEIVGEGSQVTGTTLKPGRRVTLPSPFWWISLPVSRNRLFENVLFVGVLRWLRDEYFCFRPRLATAMQPARLTVNRNFNEMRSADTVYLPCESKASFAKILSYLQKTTTHTHGLCKRHHTQYISTSCDAIRGNSGWTCMWTWVLPPATSSWHRSRSHVPRVIAVHHLPGDRLEHWFRDRRVAVAFSKSTALL